MNKSNYLKNNKKLMLEYDFSKNFNVNLDELTLGSDKKVWWKCIICNYEWETSINYRFKYKSICPACQAKNGKGHILVCGVNDFESWCNKNKKEDLLIEWDYKKNGKLSPKDVSYGSSKMIWWKCKNNHEYIQRLNHKTGKENCGCPYCTGVKVLKGFNDLESWCINNNRYDILNEYNNAFNIKKPDEVLFSSNTKYNFKCPFGHIYSRDIHDKTLNFAQCPVCQKSNKVSIKEKTVYYYLKKYIRDVVENYILDESTKKELDIYIPSLNTAIEYDGQFYHQNDKRDIEKNLLCMEKNIYLYRIREPKLNKLPYCNNIKLSDESPESLEKAIKFLLDSLGVKKYDISIKRDVIDIQNLVIKYNISNSFQQWCIDNKKEEYLVEWDKKRNGKVTPINVSYGTTQKYYFLCKNGHSYLQSIALKTRSGIGCPYCSCRKVIKGFNDFETWCISNKKEYLLSEWNYNKNGLLKPDAITHGSTKKVWWKCSKGHEWKASLNNRSRDRNCPICCNKVIVMGINDLETVIPQIVLIWNYDKNHTILPSEVSPYSGKLVWWKCPKCNNEWKQRISHISKGIGCPSCHYNIYRQ